jgi:hypothetical protein
MKFETRIYHILESVQYGVLYLLAAFAGGVSLDFSFPHFDKSKPVSIIFREASFQCIFLVLMAYFVRFCVKKVPILFPIHMTSKYIPYKTPEFNGEMMMGFVFLGSQLNLIQKIDFLAEQLYTYIFNETRVVDKNIKQSVEQTNEKVQNKEDTIIDKIKNHN